MNIILIGLSGAVFLIAGCQPLDSNKIQSTPQTAESDGIKSLSIDKTASGIDVEVAGDIIEFLELYVNDEESPRRTILQAPFKATLPYNEISAGDHQLRVVVGVKVLDRVSTVTRYSDFQISANPDTQPGVACDQVGINRFFGCYYQGEAFQTLRATRFDEVIDFDFGTGSPLAELPVDYFSIRWIGDFDFEAGNHVFMAEVDDGIRVYVDGKIVIDQWRNQPLTEFTGEVTLTKGRHRVEVQYYEAHSTAGVALDWDLASNMPAPTPTPGGDLPSQAAYGARDVPRSKTPSSSDIFVSPNGSGSACSQASPCALATGVSRGGFVWMTSGTYRTTSRISLRDNSTLEALEPKKAIIDFGGANVRLTLQNRATLRNIIVRNSGSIGVQVFGNENLIEGVISEYNRLSGFANYPSSGYSDLVNPTGGSFNVWKDSIARYNSEACDGAATCDDSDADGWSISAGRGNKIIHCEAHYNADDGYDIWRSYESSIINSIATNSGRDSRNRTRRIGNGNGFKMGSRTGPGPNRHTLTGNWSYDNIAGEFTCNGGEGFLNVANNVCGSGKQPCSYNYCPAGI